MTTRLLFDGDVIAFISAAGVQHTYEDSSGYLWPFANIAEGQVTSANMIHNTARKLCPDGDYKVEVYLSDPSSNFRHQIDASYKGNRKDNVQPMLLSRLKEYLTEEHGATYWEGLEADDVVGILSTADPEHTIIVGRDKDFFTIPGRYHCLKKLDALGNPVVHEVSVAEANRFHMMQALAGDRTDGYFGCPGIGMERAAKIVDDPHILVPQPGVITRGKNKGQSVTKWVAQPTDKLWASIVSHYEKEGLVEEDALRTARLARILRAEDYDQSTGKITLWVPW